MITLADGQEYTLAPVSLNVMADLEEHFGEDYFKLVDSVKPKVLRYLMWLRLRRSHPDLTEEQVGDIVTQDVLLTVFKALLERPDGKQGNAQ